MEREEGVVDMRGRREMKSDRGFIVGEKKRERERKERGKENPLFQIGDERKRTFVDRNWKETQILNLLKSPLFSS